MSRNSNIVALLFMIVLGFAQPGTAKEMPSPEQALAELKAGNARYLEGVSKHPRIDPASRLKTARFGQKPIASVLSCADARVPVELIFDKGFGELFVVRVAGNVCKTAELASLEFGALYLGTPLIVVLGHSECGAVKAAISEAELKGSLPLLVDVIRPAVARARKKSPDAKADDLTDRAIEENVRLSIESILKSPGIKKAVDAKKLLVVGAIRDLKSGKITWLPQSSSDRR
ncbi:MAG: carbonic anhydrase [Candidatus Melainabacteria bacterium]|nr:carbonic anhydrase [Candidatus Melainabacteria bacterium]